MAFVAVLTVCRAGLLPPCPKICKSLRRPHAYRGRAP